MFYYNCLKSGMFFDKRQKFQQINSIQYHVGVNREGGRIERLQTDDIIFR